MLLARRLNFAPDASWLEAVRMAIAPLMARLEPGTRMQVAQLLGGGQ